MKYWTAEREAKLRKLWEAGTEGAIIAEIMGLTRGALYGKARRLKLSARQKVFWGHPRRKDAEPAVYTPHHRQPSKPLPKTPIVETGFTPLTTLTIRDGDCHFPVEGEGETLKMCAAPAVVGKPYCIFHVGVAYKPHAPR